MAEAFYPCLSVLEVALRNALSRELEVITPSKIVAELTLGFWVSLLNAEYERILWKDLRRPFIEYIANGVSYLIEGTFHFRTGMQYILFAHLGSLCCQFCSIEAMTKWISS